MQKKCPRCGTLFECRHGEIELCQCAKVESTPQMRKYLNELYPMQCLCLECLREVAREFSVDAASQAPEPATPAATDCPAHGSARPRFSPQTKPSRNPNKER